jgi:hypothetical protein
MILTDWRTDPDLAAAMKTEAERALTPLLTVPVQAANPAPTARTPAANAAPIQAPVANAAPAAKVELTKDMAAVEVLRLVLGGNATGKLSVKWYVSSFDVQHGKGCYSTAYNVGQNSIWELHVHREKNGKPWNSTMQKTAAVGNKGATRSMEIPDHQFGRLTELGIPSNHDPRTTVKEKVWAKC